MKTQLAKSHENRNYFNETEKVNLTLIRLEIEHSIFTQVVDYSAS